MLKLEYPEHDFRIREEEGRPCIFDAIRKKWVVLNPEEWVRQNFVQYLIQIKQYPSSVMSIEKEIKLNNLKKRCDIVVYRDMNPWMIVECKEMDVPISSQVLEQVLMYNIRLQVPYMVLTNGVYTFAWERKEGSMNAIQELPDWNL